jgi:hypothetical protein
MKAKWLICLMLLALPLLGQDMPTASIEELKDRYIVYSINYAKLTAEAQRLSTENANLKEALAWIETKAQADSVRKVYQIEPKKKENKSK